MAPQFRLMPDAWRFEVSASLFEFAYVFGSWIPQSKSRQSRPIQPPQRVTYLSSVSHAVSAVYIDMNEWKCIGFPISETVWDLAVKGFVRVFVNRRDFGHPQ